MTPLVLVLAVVTAEFDSRDCVALVVFSEARSQSYLGQALVAQVVVNRAIQADQGLCDVATAPDQFHGVDY